MITTLPAAPTRDPIGTVRDAPVRLSALWERWFARLVVWLSKMVSMVGQLTLTAQSSSITTTAIPTTLLATAVYRVTYYVRVTQAATVSSSLAVSVQWTDGGAVCTWSGSAVTGNRVTDTQTGTLLVHVDAGSSISYATTYASSGATSMQYRLDIRVEELS